MIFLYESKNHVNRCHVRWIEKTNRDLRRPDKPDEWVWNQCEGCRYWVPIIGKFSGDWGVCSNENSASDGIARFAHDGCDHFETTAEDSIDGTIVDRP
ncbi:DUF3027 domain-containing protein [Tahibacter harae]|uniref:DUF3027 domain-containing protein n=1 Tax=Tahibacter harae TaxID=2963937 RepID=UPI0034E09784